MRLSDRIVFVNEIIDETYNFDTGEYEGGESTRDSVPCAVSDLGLDRSMQVFGDYSKTRKVVRLLHPYTKPYSYVEYRGKSYQIVASRQDAKVLYIERDSVGGG